MPRTSEGTLEEQFEAELRRHAKYWAENGLSAGRMYVVLAQVGVIEMAKRYVRKPAGGGFAEVSLRLGPNRTLEAMVARPYYAALFDRQNHRSSEAQARSKQRDVLM